MLSHRIAAIVLLAASAGVHAEDAAAPPAPAEAPAPTPAEAPTTPATDLVPITPVSEMPVAPLAAAPELTPPDIDAYLDPSFSGTDFGNTGIDDHPVGYRFIVGFEMKPAEGSPWRIAPEVAYFRLGAAEDISTVLDTNPPVAGYDALTRTTRTIDVTSLDFGARGTWLHERFSVFGRAGLNAYNASRQVSVVTHFTPDIPGDPARPPFDDRPPTQSRTNIGVAWYGSLGVGYSLGTIPTIYVEYGGREVVGNTLTTTSIGVLLNF